MAISTFFVVKKYSRGDISPQKDHRMVEIGQDLWRSSGSTSLLRQDHLEHTAQDWVRQLLNNFKDEDSTTSLGNLSQRSVTLTVKK